MLLTVKYVSLRSEIVGAHVITFRNEDQEPLFCGATPPPSSLEELDIVWNRMSKDKSRECREKKVSFVAGNLEA